VACLYLMYGMRCSHVWDHPTMHPLGATELPSWQLRTMRCSVDYVRPYVACVYLMYVYLMCSHLWDYPTMHPLGAAELPL
jgi:hypothetical protein